MLCFLSQGEKSLRRSSSICNGVPLYFSLFHTIPVTHLPSSSSSDTLLFSAKVKLEWSGRKYLNKLEFGNLCLVLLQVPKAFGLVLIFCAWPKDDFHSQNLFFYAGTKVFEEALNAVKFGPAQNILGPVKGQGISFHNNESLILQSSLTI